MLRDTGKTLVYIYFPEIPGAKKALRKLEKYLISFGIDPPRFTFPEDELPREIFLNAERIRKVKESFPEPLREPFVEVLTNIADIMTDAGEALAAGERHDKATVLGILKKKGIIGRLREENRQREQIEAETIQ